MLNIKFKINLNIRIYLFDLDGNSFIYFSSSRSSKFFRILPIFNFYVYKDHVFTFYLKRKIDTRFFLKDVKIFSIFLTNVLNGLNRVLRKNLILNGLGFKARLIKNKNLLELKLGFSHIIHATIPNLLVAKVSKNSIIFESYDYSMAGNFTAIIKNLKIPDLYKGKGILLKNEVKILKEIKKK
jgi:hypothetical protein